MTTDNELKKVLDIPRKGLIYLRKQYNTNLVKAALVIVSAVLVTVCLGLVADAFLPLSSFMNWAIVVKTFIAVPLCPFFPWPTWCHYSSTTPR